MTVPDGGKIVVLAPEVAARAAGQHPDLAERIYTFPGIDPTQAYVIDLDYFAVSSPADEAKP